MYISTSGNHIHTHTYTCIHTHTYIYILRNLYAGQEATIRPGHGTTDWFQIGKGVRQGCILSPCLYNLYDVLLQYYSR